MAAIFQPTYTKVLPDGRKVTRHSPTWWIEYSHPTLGRRIRVKGYRDKMATEIKGSDLERKAQRGDVGAQDPFEATRRLPFTEHLKEYKTHLKPSYLNRIREASLIGRGRDETSLTAPSPCSAPT